MATQIPQLTPPELLRESQRLREEFELNVVKLRITLQKAQAVASEWTCAQWHESEAAPQDTPNVHLLDSLTRREVEVLRLIAEGKSSKEIALELGIAFRTAVCHRYRIFQKLQVHETASVVRIAVRAGLIRP